MGENLRKMKSRNAKGSKSDSFIQHLKMIVTTTVVKFVIVGGYSSTYSGLMDWTLSRVVVPHCRGCSGQLCCCFISSTKCLQPMFGHSEESSY